MGADAQLAPRLNGSVQPPRRVRWWWPVVGAFIAALLALLWLTRPPPMPTFAQVHSAWQPSEAWLYDAHGVLLDSQRIDFQQRRGAWVPLAKIGKALPAAVIRSEDRRFRIHDGVDWLAVAAAARARLTGDRSRGASTITMPFWPQNWQSRGSAAGCRNYARCARRWCSAIAGRAMR